MTDPRFSGHARLHGHEPAAGADTHGIPWHGREVTSTGFDDDRGEADPSVLRALQELAVAERGEGPVVEAEIALVAELLGARFLVPVVAAPIEVDDASGLRADTVSEMATVTLSSPDGVMALPVFTSVAALARWDSSARPVPVTARAAAQGALEDGCQVLVLDLGSEHATELRSSMVWALAQGRGWLPGYADERVRGCVTEAVSRVEGVRAGWVESAPGRGSGVTQVSLELSPGLTAGGVTNVVESVASALALNPDVRIRLDEVTFWLTHSEAGPPPQT